MKGIPATLALRTERGHGGERNPAIEVDLCDGFNFRIGPRLQLRQSRGQVPPVADHEVLRAARDRPVGGPLRIDVVECTGAVALVLEVTQARAVMGPEIDEFRDLQIALRQRLLEITRPIRCGRLNQGEQENRPGQRQPEAATEIISNL